ncbi:hypothetical protein FSP39_014544 [Pinctada imbricata]|uniref:Uncharacterized protein n=1 Tax=Pinctada imbricata TaxID=66713 RepID=A0AA89BX51_PINIB|nr:hypothetical protein FSP39_014544 [Pinctada imbricata]
MTTIRTQDLIKGGVAEINTPSGAGVDPKPYNSHKPHYNEFSKSMKFSSNHTPCGEFKASPYSASRDLQDSTYRSSEEATRSSSRSLSPDGKDGEKMTGKENTRSYYKYSTDSERNRKGSSYHDRDRHYKRYKDYNEHYDKDRRYSNDSEKSRYVGGDKRREFEGSRKRSADRDSVPSAANKVREDAKRQKRTLLSELKKLKEENEKLKAENEQNLKQMEEQNAEIASLIAFKESIVNIATRKDS